MKLSTILDQIDNDTLGLPKFQRGYVWKRPDVRKLLRSLYKGYPVGSLLVWETSTNQDVRGKGPPATVTRSLLLDGQQRITSLYGVIRGEPPSFFDGDSQQFLKLYFNLAEEEFEFYGPVKMQDDPNWISVTELMQSDQGEFIQRFVTHPDLSAYITRLSAISNIKDRDFHIDIVSGEDKTVDVVVDIFNEVNSSGTELSKGDLALARIGAEWPEVREELQKRLEKWQRAGYVFNLDLLLRCINAILTEQAEFSALSDVHMLEIQKGLQSAENHIDSTLNLISSRLGLDDSTVLRSHNSMPAMVSYLDKVRGQPDHRQQSQLLYWYVNTMIWGRYSASSETVIRQDLIAISENDDAITALIQKFRENRRDLRLQSSNFSAATSKSRFFPMLYMLIRVHGACDFASGLELSKHLLSPMNRLERHHLFPKYILRKNGFDKRDETNALANFTFLTKQTNLQISARYPDEYFPEYEAKHPGVLASHWIPMDRDLWRIENYQCFLAARRELLAKAANDFLDKLKDGKIPETHTTEPTLEQKLMTMLAGTASAEEEAQLISVMDWMESNGLPRGVVGFELLTSEDSDAEYLDLAWPDGIQVGRSRPVALLIDEGEETLKVAQGEGYRCFTSVEQLQRYVRNDILGE